MNVETNIYADGTNFIFFWKDGKAEMTYTFEKPIITEINVNTSRNVDMPPGIDDNVKIFGGKELRIQRPPPDITFEVNGVCRGDKYKVESSDIGGLIPKLKIFDKVTISELFYVINRKLNKRK